MLLVFGLTNQNDSVRRKNDVNNKLSENSIKAVVNVVDFFYARMKQTQGLQNKMSTALLYIISQHHNVIKSVNMVHTDKRNTLLSVTF